MSVANETPKDVSHCGHGSNNLGSHRTNDNTNSRHVPNTLVERPGRQAGYSQVGNLCHRPQMPSDDIFDFPVGGSLGLLTTQSNGFAW